MVVAYFLGGLTLVFVILGYLSLGYSLMLGTQSKSVGPESQSTRNKILNLAVPFTVRKSAWSLAKDYFVLLLLIVHVPGWLIISDSIRQQTKRLEGQAPNVVSAEVTSLEKLEGLTYFFEKKIMGVETYQATIDSKKTFIRVPVDTAASFEDMIFSQKDAVKVDLDKQNGGFYWALDTRDYLLNRPNNFLSFSFYLGLYVTVLATPFYLLLTLPFLGFSVVFKYRWELQARIRFLKIIDYINWKALKTASIEKPGFWEFFLQGAPFRKYAKSEDGLYVVNFDGPVGTRGVLVDIFDKSYGSAGIFQDLTEGIKRRVRYVFIPEQDVQKYLDEMDSSGQQKAG